MYVCIYDPPVGLAIVNSFTTLIQAFAFVSALSPSLESHSDRPLVDTQAEGGHLGLNQTNAKALTE